MKLNRVTYYIILTIVFSINSGAAQTWTNIMTEDFEGTFPNGLWQAWPQNGYTDCYWGSISIGNNNRLPGVLLRVQMPRSLQLLSIMLIL